MTIVTQLATLVVDILAMSEQGTPYRSTWRENGGVGLRIPGSGLGWGFGIGLALLADYGLHELTMSWWFSYFTGVLPGHDSPAGWWSLAGNALRWCLALATCLTTGAALARVTRAAPRANGERVTVWCFRRSAPSLKIGLALLAGIAGGVAYAALDTGENPAVNDAFDEIVLAAFFMLTIVSGALAVAYANDLVPLDLRRVANETHAHVKRAKVLELRALDVDRFVVRTAGLSETYILAGRFRKRSDVPVGAYAIEAACSPPAVDDTAAEVGSPAPLQLSPDAALHLPGAALPWWVGGAIGVCFAAWLSQAKMWSSIPHQHWASAKLAMCIASGWVVAVLAATVLPSTRARSLHDREPIRFHLLLARARQEETSPAIGGVRTLLIGAAIATGTLVVLPAPYYLALLVVFILVIPYFLFTYPGIWFFMVSPLRLLRDARTLDLDASGVWLQGKRVTACESVGGAVVVHTGLEPTWLRVASISRDKARWKREADSIAAYVQARLGARVQADSQSLGTRP